MFLLTQFIGLVVLQANPLKITAEINGTAQEVSNPYLGWIDPPEPETKGEFASIFSQILIAFVVAIVLLFLLMKFKVEIFLRFWFFAVVSLALFLSFLAFIKIIPWFTLSIEKALIISAILALPLAFLKIFKRNILVHNFTELLIYPGIAVVFVPLLNIYTIIALLILISVYDMWAVWKSGVMQKMAKYQIKKLRIFSGFFVPYLTKKQKQKLKKLKMSKSPKKKAMKVSVAILGGGDIIFPIITAGVMLKTLGLLSAVFVILGAALGLGYLFFLAKKKKFYPAMPFITAGIFAAMILSWIIL
jgi:presenilin-like A22 family membrane protease